MNSSLLLILAIAGLVYFWLDAARARELAVSVVDALCRQRGYQLLDETVALSRLSVVRTPEGLRFRRVFRFDYSIEGVGRLQGHILLYGSRPVDIDVQEQDTPPEPAASAPPPVTGGEKKQGDDNVVPFRRRH